ncbi:hypothetical protein RCL_jg22566.t1 [Rhizophagus clarus]|uniref:Uncharacterized protein n=1 Tax=Rhizophagus clarus TaxID=94130 RepID=A0A8H3R4C9_9GLOM|nr:hypothetical protein RCL_jg22566.t1 [Rhizophagus clarus]
MDYVDQTKLPKQIMYREDVDRKIEVEEKTFETCEKISIAVEITKLCYSSRLILPIKYRIAVVAQRN